MRSLLRKIKGFRKKRSSKFINPYYQEKKSTSLSWNTSLKVKLIVVSVVIASLASLWCLFFSSFFTITEINVTGATRIPTHEIIRIAKAKLGQPKLILANQSNIFLYDINDLKDAITKKYYLESLEVYKDTPRTIEILLAEKDYSAIWREGDNYFYIDEIGGVIDRANPLEIKKNYPLIDNTGDKKFNKDQVVGGQVKIEYILRVFAVLRQEHPEITEKLDRFLIDETNTIKVVLLEGPYILFDVTNDLNKQVIKMITIINEKIRSDFFTKEYIDLRYGDRVYYR